MDEKNKGKSLRKKSARPPKAAAPKQISGPLPPGQLPSARSGPQSQPAKVGANGNRSLDVPRERPQQSGKTSDLVKRRYSTRFTQLPADFDSTAPPVPSVPSIPGQFSSQPPSRDGRPQTGSDGPKIKVDMKAVRDPNLRPGQYVASLLVDATEQDIREYQQDLRKVKNRTSTDLQHNVYQNRTQFIKISKEAEKLKSEMRTLRSLMSELTGTLGQTTAVDATAGDTQVSRRHANRSSVANLEALWSTHLQTLWKRVEGSQKYLPAIPGRHIEYESGRWLELNAATWKVRRRVHIILLNDHLLIACEKKRTDAAAQNGRDMRQKGGQAQGQLVAQRCWPLQDVRMTDLAAGSAANDFKGDKVNTSGALSVRVGSESFTYAISGSDSSEKSALLTLFRKAVEDLRRTLDAEVEDRGASREPMNFFGTRASNFGTQIEAQDSLNDAASQKSISFIDMDGNPQSIRWVDSQLDALDIDVALQQFETAVGTIERLKKLAKGIKSNALAQDIVNYKVDTRAAKLASVILRQLADTHSKIASTKENVGWLSRLGFEDLGRIHYLDARTAVLKKRIRQCIFDGDLYLYIYQLSFIYFTIIKNTVEVYQDCFAPAMMSACVKWAKEQVEDFNVILARQLSSVDQSSQTWKNCMSRVYTHASMLAQVGLDFKGIIGMGLEMTDDPALPTSDQPKGLGLK